LQRFVAVCEAGGLKEVEILAMTTRDRNRIGLQSDLLGAGAFGINNVLCLTGDHQKFGDYPNAANVFDLDSTQLIQTVKQMRDGGCNRSWSVEFMKGCRSWQESRQ
jgi:5,10-methylenetetrahydrofolate reductase